MKAIALHESSGSSARIQWAKRADGAWFRRAMRRTHYGYQWGRWTPSEPAPPPGPITQESIDWGTPTYGSHAIQGVVRVRLPA
jgi:hypothetical protein